MISLWIGSGREAWLGVAESSGALVSTTVAGSRDEAARRIMKSLPKGAPCRLEEGLSDFARETISMLEALERGDEGGKRFELSPEYVVQPLRGVLIASAAIPLGYATTYGDIAAVTLAAARVVGRIMATNPLYPIVPCHRVVGADLSLVGYRGSRDAADLRAKLDRLRAEAKGNRAEHRIEAVGGLRVVPVEWVIAASARESQPLGRQLSLW